MIAYGSFSRRKDERKEKITNYWAKRSDSFMEQRRAELHSDMADKWLKEIGTFLPDGKLRILDVGCGAGSVSYTHLAIAYVGIKKPDGTLAWGAGVDADIIRASIDALVTAINNR